MSEPSLDPSSEPFLALRTTLLPRDTNQHGTIFGGVLLSHLDMAGAVGVRHAISTAGWPQQPIVTVAMNKVEFHQPVYVGDLISFWTEVVRVGRTSITVHVRVEADRPDGTTVNVTEADVTFVAVSEDPSGQRTPVPIRGAATE